VDTAELVAMLRLLRCGICGRRLESRWTRIRSLVFAGGVHRGLGR